MSQLFQQCSQEETLGRIQERLNQGAASVAIIKELSPQSRDEAVSWGRRLTGWDEYHYAFPAQVVALARVISRRAMHEFRLMLREDGCVVERPAERKGWKMPPPAAVFPLVVGGEEVQVRYTTGYFPSAATDLVYFVSPHEPPKPHALSETGYFSRFVPHDAVEACGGPQAYAALLADALLRGEEQQFIEAFEGQLAETDPRHHREANRPTVQPGGHAERVIAEKEMAKESPQQGLLF